MTTYEAILLQRDALAKQLRHPFSEDHRLALEGALERAQAMIDELKRMPICEGAAVPVEVSR